MWNYWYTHISRRKSRISRSRIQMDVRCSHLITPSFRGYSTTTRTCISIQNLEKKRRWLVARRCVFAWQVVDCVVVFIHHLEGSSSTLFYHLPPSRFSRQQQQRRQKDPLSPVGALLHSQQTDDSTLITKSSRSFLRNHHHHRRVSLH